MPERIWTAAQQAAINSGDVDLLVCAGAGSGKSSVLVERVISHITDPALGRDLDRMLIITFTKKSAADLRKKIADALAARLQLDPDNDHIRRQASLLDSARISTIDSFFTELVDRHRFELGIPASVSVSLDGEIHNIIATAMEDTIEQIHRGNGPVTTDEMTSLCKDFTVGDTDISKCFIDLFNTLSNTIRGIDTLTAQADALDDTDDERFFSSLIGTHVLGKTREVLEHFDRAYTEMINYFSGYEHGVFNYIPVLTKEHSGIKNALEALLSDTASYSRVKSAIADITKGTLGRKKKPDYPEMLLKTHYLKNVRDAFLSEVPKLLDKFYVLPGEMLRDVCTVAAAKTRSIHGVLEFFDKMRRDALERNSLMTMSDNTRCVLRLVCNENGEPTQTAREISERFDEVYIDEYQDVNPVQDLIFRCISPANRRFMVGDIKQCIYAFRDSDPSLFAHYRDTFEPYGADSQGEAVLFLSENFRCSKNIISTVNKVFSVVFNTVDSVVSYKEEDELRFNPTPANASQQPVKIIIGNKNETTCGKLISNEIKRLIATGVKGKDILILARTENNIGAVCADLESNNIKYSYSIGKDLFLENDVSLVRSILHCIDDPFDDIATAAVLCSPIYELTLDDIASLRIKYGKADRLYRLVCGEAEEDTNGVYGRFKRDIEHLADMARQMPSDRLILYVYNMYSLASLLCAAPDFASNDVESDLQYIYNIALGYEKSSFKGLYKFVRYIDRLAKAEKKLKVTVGMQDDDSVTVMTIHGSKGLEYPYVFIAEAQASLYNANIAESGIVYNNKLGIGLKQRGSKGFVRFNTPLSSSVTERNMKKSIDESQRLLYVAMTRAISGLYVVGTVNDPEEYLSSISYRAASYDSYDVYKDRSFLSWICAALANVADDGEFEIIPVIDADREESNEAPAVEADIARAAALSETLKKRIGYVYPYNALSEIPAKLTVSKLYPGVLDEADDSGTLETEGDYTMKLPRFLSGGERDGAFSGTSTHLFMQFCDFESVEMHGIEHEIERLVRDSYIDRENANAISLKHLDRFFSSQLFSQMKKAPFIRREMRFNVLLPAAEFSKDAERVKALGNETITVQGVIDCIFEDENGDIVLLDYKTDSVYGMSADEASEMLRRRHALQLRYYKAAMEKLLGKRVSKTLIYSFPLGQTVEVS